MRSKRAKAITREVKAAHGGKVDPGTIRDAKRNYTRKGFFLSQNPKLKESRRKIRLEINSMLAELNNL